MTLTQLRSLLISKIRYVTVCIQDTKGKCETHRYCQTNIHRKHKTEEKNKSKINTLIYVVLGESSHSSYHWLRPHVQFELPNKIARADKKSRQGCKTRRTRKERNEANGKDEKRASAPPQCRSNEICKRRDRNMRQVIYKAVLQILACIITGIIKLPRKASYLRNRNKIVQTRSNLHVKKWLERYQLVVSGSEHYISSYKYVSFPRERRTSVTEKEKKKEKRKKKREKKRKKKTERVAHIGQTSGKRADGEDKERAEKKRNDRRTSVRPQRRSRDLCERAEARGEKNEATMESSAL